MRWWWCGSFRQLIAIMEVVYAPLNRFLIISSQTIGGNDSYNLLWESTTYNLIVGCDMLYSPDRNWSSQRTDVFRALNSKDHPHLKGKTISGYFVSSSLFQRTPNWYWTTLIECGNQLDLYEKGLKITSAQKPVKIDPISTGIHLYI